MSAIYLVGGRARAQLTQLVVRAVVELFFSYRGWAMNIYKGMYCICLLFHYLSCNPTRACMHRT